MPMQQVFMPARVFNIWTGEAIDTPVPLTNVKVFRTEEGAQEFIEMYKMLSTAPDKYFTILVYTVE